MTSAEKKRVLIVDDEHVIANTLATIFSHAGYESRAAYSAESALELIPSWPPHLAIVDVVLPAMNGIDCAILLKAISPDCTIQLFSGRLDTISLQEAARQRGILLRSSQNRCTLPNFSLWRPPFFLPAAWSIEAPRL